jgi:hypothetical protein
MYIIVRKLFSGTLYLNMPMGEETGNYWSSTTATFFPPDSRYLYGMKLARKDAFKKVLDGEIETVKITFG